MMQIFLGDDNNNYKSTTSGDRIYGEGGNDSISASSGGNELYGGAGDDRLYGGRGNDVLQGDDETSFTSRNVLKGFGGDDVITSFSWYDRVDGGNGDDVVGSYAQTTGQLLDGGNGSDTISMQSLSDTDLPVNISMGSTFVAVVGGVNGATYMNFEVLKVTLGTGRNTVKGGEGDDFLLTAYQKGSNATTEFDAGFVHGGGGDDIIAFNGITRPGTGIERLTGGPGIDRLGWTNGTSAITDLTIDAMKGTMFALDRIFATFSGFEIHEFRTYEGHTGVFSYVGSNTVDNLNVGFTSSVIKGNGGNDFITVNAGTSNVNGGKGDDNINLQSNGASAQVLRGAIGNDTITGGAGQSDIFGDGGDDQLSANNGRSHLSGGSGDDILYLTTRYSMLGSGAAVIQGGAGRDVLTLELALTSGAMTENLSAASIKLADGTSITGCEAISFSAGNANDDLTASNDALGLTANILLGMGGSDILRASRNGATLDGGGDDDTLVGGRGADRLLGNSGNDDMAGGRGNDTLIGGFGKDRMTGGLGADTFSLIYSFESGNDTAARDVITDLLRSEGDRLGLADIDANALTIGNDAFVFIRKAAFGKHAGELRYENVDLAGTAKDYTLLTGDTNGDGLADFSIELSGLIQLTGVDFIL